jgi:8-oxo-dGTP diphosphatase
VNWEDLIRWVKSEGEARDDEVLERKLFLPLLNLVRQRPGVNPTAHEVRL